MKRTTPLLEAVIADIGCGKGAILNEIGIDKNPQKVVWQTIARGDAETLPLKDNSVDLIISTQVIEHVINEEKMLEEIYRVLKVGGKAYIETVFKKKWARWFRGGKLSSDHKREYTEEWQLIEKILRVGFRVLNQKKRPATLGLFWKIRVPVKGYYWWEIVIQKKEAGKDG